MRCTILVSLGLLAGCGAIQSDTDDGPIYLTCSGTTNFTEPKISSSDATTIYRVDRTSGSFEAWSGARWNRLGDGKAEITPETISLDSNGTNADGMTNHWVIYIDRVTGTFTNDVDASWMLDGKPGKISSSTSGNCEKTETPPSDERKF